MTLSEVIRWLEKQNPNTVVVDGFGEPHTDRGDYCDLAFDPIKKTTFGKMLEHAKSAVGATFGGWKGGEYKMHDYTDCYIGEFGECGEQITSAHLRLWVLTADGCAEI